MSDGPSRRVRLTLRRRRPVGARPVKRFVRVLTVVLWGVVIAAAGYWAVGEIRAYNETNRTTTRFDPPVWAGQNVPGACSGGFYARSGSSIVLTIVGHCATPGVMLRDTEGRMIGV